MTAGLTGSNRLPIAGGICCGVFLITEAIRSVYFGAVFQQASSFLVGGLVFGVISISILGYTMLANRGQLAMVWRHRRQVAALNVLTAASWAMYFLAVQLIEPAVVYTVFSGVILLTMLAASRTERREASPLTALGYRGIVVALAFLVLTTLFGLSGFVRGPAVNAVLGLALSVGASVTIAIAMIWCKRLDERGVQPLTQLGVRFVLYFLVAGALGLLGFDAKGEPVALPMLIEIVALGILLTASAGYAVQRAVSELSSVSIGAASAFGPCLVFGLQMIEGRVAFTPWTLAGICLYCAAAVIVSVGPVVKLSFSPSRRRAPVR